MPSSCPSHRAAVLCVACAQLIHITTHSGAGATGTGKDGVQREGWSSVKEVKGLAKLLLKPSPARLRGTHEAQGVLIRADPGTGKTWSMNQLTHRLAESLKADSKGAGIKLVPLLVPVLELLVVPLEQEYPLYSVDHLFLPPFPLDGNIDQNDPYHMLHHLLMLQTFLS